MAQTETRPGELASSIDATMAKIIKFFDADVRPPRGGWHCVVEGVEFHGTSEDDVVQQVSQWRLNNGTFEGAAAVQAELWKKWCENEPTRCIGYPSTMKMAKDLVKTAKRVVTAAVEGKPIVAKKPERKSRMEICRSCEFYHAADNRCRQCGCLLAAKTVLAEAKCPIGRW